MLNSSLNVGLDLSALDPNFKAHAARGIGRYVRELQNYFLNHVDSSVQVGSFDHSISRLTKLIPFGRTTLTQQILYPLRLKKKMSSHFDVLHFPAHMDPPAWGMGPYVVTVLDLIPLVLSDLYKADNPNWRFRLARSLEIRAIQNASLILAISENTKRDVNRVLGIPEDKIVVTPLGVDRKFFIDDYSEGEKSEIANKFGIVSKEPMLLYVGGIDPRKNIATMLKALRILIDNSGFNPTLIMAGKIESDRQYPALKRTLRELDLEKNVLLPGFVTDEDLLKLYSLSSAFVFPSLYEGFGLPPLEAMAAGVPVVSSNSSAMPEMLADAAALVDPSNAEQMAFKVLDVLSNSELASDLATRGRKRAAQFSWERTGVETLNAYKRFLN